MSDYIAGVFGLVGTAIGAMATLIPAYTSDRRAAKAAATNARRDAIVTALLLVDDLDLARRRLRAAYRHGNGRFWSADFALPLSTWVEGRAQIAHNLSPEVFETVAPAFRELNEIEKTAGAERSGDPAARPEIGVSAAAWLKRVADDVLPRAITTLAAFAESPEPADVEGEV